MRPALPPRPDNNQNNNQAGSLVRQTAHLQSNEIAAIVDDVVASDPSDPRNWPPPHGVESLTDSLQKGMFVDVRDTLGKWLQARVLDVVHGDPLVNYIGWDPKWDEVVSSTSRIAAFQKYSSVSQALCGYEVGSKVMVWMHKPANSNCWVGGTVTKMDGQQMQVEYYFQRTRHQYWYHAQTDEIRSADREEAKAVSIHPNMTNGTYFKGQFLEVRDGVTLRWRPAEVCKLRVETNEILIHYDGMAASWDEYLNVETDSDRIKPLGADIPDTPEIAKAKRDDEEFREGLKSKGMAIVDVERDGNCLFRSVAHQMYNDVSKHAEVRKMCYDYMVQDTEFFSCFVAEEFSKYVERQKQLNQWGDHPEVVALRELFNVNVEVYDKANFPSPLYVAMTEGINCTLRLSFHGHNHYNSLVGPDFTPPLMPLVQQSKVNLRQLRLSQMKTLNVSSAPPADAKVDPVFERRNTICSLFGLTAYQGEPRAVDIESQIMDVVRLSNRNGHLVIRDCETKIIPECLRLLREARIEHWKKKGDRAQFAAVEREYQTSVNSIHELTKILCQGVTYPKGMAAEKAMVVLKDGFVKNLLLLDEYWGKVLLP